MRVVLGIGALLTGVVGALPAQHAHQLEFGGYGAYTRYDPAFQLVNQVGGGGRLGFWLNDFLGLEVDGNVAYPKTKAGSTVAPGLDHTQTRFGSASLVINSGGNLYLLGGYSKLDMGVNAPYNFALDAFHGGIGDRVFFSNRLALRFEARGYYAPKNCCINGQAVTFVTGSVGLSYFLFGAHGPEAAPEMPKARRDSILAAGGTPPPVERPTYTVAYEGTAEHAHQIELGAFGTYTRYDHLFYLNNQFGAGGRLAYFFNEFLGLEFDAHVSRPTPTAGGAATQVRFGSASLVINGGTGRNVLYVLGGYSRLDMGVNPPYNFALHAAHGGIGDRIFLTDRLALRLEARAYYAPSSCCLTPNWVGHVTGSAGLSYFFFGAHPTAEVPQPEIPKARRDSILAAGGRLPEAPPPPRGGPSFEQRVSDWQHKWYWGGQAGVLVFKTNTDPYSFEPTFGGHWLVTSKKTALYAAYEESIFLSARHATAIDPTGGINPGNVQFNNLRRIMIGVLAFPAQLRVEPFAGGGFAIMEALNVQTACSATCSFAQATQFQQEAQDAATKAFFWWMGGIDIKQGRLALYGHYILTSSSASFLIQGTTHTFQGGIRYSFGSAKESITERY
ncbi:MAG TPA: hypothetical protein VM736_13350 [Gemmatimonadales bacterium]|nr:hypothetical protein [Gemmatimonadales bacterium]